MYIYEIESPIIGGSRAGRGVGGRRRRAPPNGIQFFRLHTRFRRKAPVWEVGAPPTGNPGSTTVYVIHLINLQCRTDIKIVVDIKS